MNHLNDNFDTDKLTGSTEEQGGSHSRRQRHKSKKKKKKYKWSFKRFLWSMFKLGFCLCLIAGLAVIGYVWSIISDAPEIDTSNIYSMLSQSSVLYDDAGEVMDSIVGSDGENRTIVSLSEMPETLRYAFIALEDKTFETHNGFNIVRIFGAIRDAVFSGGDISGTSTITQQLARNLYLEDQMTERSLNRKITEAYYAIILEEKLTKDEILETYLNTIYFGSMGYGVQAASQAYFSKDVSELTLAECAALAALPQAPSDYALVKQVSANEINDDTENLIMTDGDVAYVWNDSEALANRIKTCLALMLEQGYITEAEYNKAILVEVKDMVNPNVESFSTESNYFADYVIETVISDLQEEYGYDYSTAYNMVYSGGLRIYTTMNTEIQTIVETELEDSSNFPTIVASNKDSNGNILDEYGSIMLYQYSNYFDGSGYFYLTADDYEWNSNGSLTIYRGRRLNLYDTTVGGESDVSVEFKNMYVTDDDTFYTISGGYVNIPQGYKSKDDDGNLVISAQFFKDYPNFFVTDEDGETLLTKEFSLQQRVVQPQAAMTIIDNETGYVKAMVGGRQVTGRMILNRATSLRQSGSSIKPLSVYAAALQKSYEVQAAGEEFDFVDSTLGAQGAELWGSYLTAASIIDDEPTTLNDELWPTNSGGGYNGLLTMRRALQLSLNVCAVKIMEQVGVEYAYNLVEKFGITSLVGEGESNDVNLAALALGGQTNGVSTLEMASAYSTFVNDGVHKSYNVYTKVTTRSGDILLETETTETQVLDSGVAWIMRDMLQSVVTNGLGTAAAVTGASAGGKTGTTSEQYDIWFDGFTAKYSAALWIGCDVNIKLSSMSGKAASLWGKIMNQIPDVADGTYSDRPSNVIAVTVDSESGMLPGEYTTSTKTEYFTKGTEPTESDTLHQSVEICSETGYLATPSCTETTTTVGIMRPYVPDEKVSDGELPHYYCNLHNPDPEEYPVEEGVEVTIVEIPEEDEEDEEADIGDMSDITDGSDDDLSGDVSSDGSTDDSSSDTVVTDAPEATIPEEIEEE